MNYQIITDEDALEAFIQWLPELEENEKYYLCLFARKKYCSEIGWIKSDKTQMKRLLSDKERMLEKIWQMECPIGSYRQGKDGEPYAVRRRMPQEALALYITPNPRDLWRANFQAVGDLGKVIQCEGRSSNPHQEVMSSIQRTRGTKHFVTFDIDEKDGVSTLNKIRGCFQEEQPEGAVTILETRGGYHVLIRPSMVVGRDAEKGAWHRALSALADVKGDAMMPVPGTFQGGFTPRFVQV